jgi:hypothetical protein
MLDLVLYKKNIINIKLLSNFRIFYVKAIFSHKQLFIELIKNNTRCIVPCAGSEKVKKAGKIKQKSN